MKVGFFAVGIGTTVEPDVLRAVVTAAERLGFATVWAPEHVVLVEQYASKYPYSSGRFPGPASLPIGDPFTTLAYAAACTSTIRLGTGICLVPEHNPLVLAKTAATLDRLAGGRFILGAGVGWLAEEFQALGIPFERRAARTREYIDIMRKLWTEETSSHQGEFAQFTGVASYPKPAASKGIPAGSAARAVRRCAGLPNTATAGLGSRYRRTLPAKRSGGSRSCCAQTAADAPMSRWRSRRIPTRLCRTI